MLCKLDNVSDSGDGWSARCPAHPDTNNSLSVNIGWGGIFLMKCHRGCEFDEIVESARMMPQEMFTTTPSIKRAILPPRQPCNIEPSPTSADPVWESKQIELCDPIHSHKVQDLAEQLGVTCDSLNAIGVGWCMSTDCWTFPERNGKREICGIVRRFNDGTKRAFAGGHRGLTLPKGFDEAEGTLYICEGASDVSAALSHGMRAIGRPAAHSGFDDLDVLLREFPDEIMVVADNDESGTGTQGAERLARQLSNSLQKRIDVSSPPAGYKDLRQWLNHGKQR